MSCLAASVYSMKADIYTPTVSRNATNGMVSKSWELTETINCYARSLIGARSNSSNVEIKDQIVINRDYIKIRSKLPILSSQRIVAIRSADGVIWTEEYIANSKGGVDGSTIFEPRGSTPIINFDGRIIEYETILQRQEIQQLEGL